MKTAVTFVWGRCEQSFGFCRSFEQSLKENCLISLIILFLECYTSSPFSRRARQQGPFEMQEVTLVSTHEVIMYLEYKGLCVIITADLSQHSFKKQKGAKRLGGRGLSVQVGCEERMPTCPCDRLGWKLVGVCDPEEISAAKNLWTKRDTKSQEQTFEFFLNLHWQFLISNLTVRKRSSWLWHPRCLSGRLGIFSSRSPHPQKSTTWVSSWSPPSPSSHISNL